MATKTRKNAFPLTIEVSSSDDGFTNLKVTGEINSYTGSLFDNHLMTIKDSDAGMIVDLREVEYLDAHACGLIARAFKLSKKLGKIFFLRVREETIVHKVFRIAKFNSHINMIFEPVNKN